MRESTSMEAVRDIGELESATAHRLIHVSKAAKQREVGSPGSRPK